MKNRIMNFVKSNRWVYNIYYGFFSMIVRMIALFVKSDNSLILFTCYGGRSCGDSPRAIYEKMITDGRFSDCKIVWAFRNPNEIDIPIGDKIKIDTLKYFRTALRARVWVTNSETERGLNFRGKNTYYVNTWHGTPIKKLGRDYYEHIGNGKSRRKHNVDVMTAQGDFDVAVLGGAFGMSSDKFIKCGLPRNDELLESDGETVREIRHRLGIPNGKRVILYAPTYREYETDGGYNRVLHLPFDTDMWQRKLGGEYCVLFRVHYDVAEYGDMTRNGFVYDVSDYDSLNDLIKAADILISDYSSIFFDFSVTGKPMFRYTYDYDTYAEKRGVYFDIRKYISGSDNENDLTEIIADMNYESETERTKRFREEYVQYFGNASETVLDNIYDNVIRR